MVMFQGRMMSTEEVIRIRNNTKAVIETTENTPKVEEQKEVIVSPKVEESEVITDDIGELQTLQAEYKEIFGRKPNPSTKLETLKEKIAQASEV